MKCKGQGDGLSWEMVVEQSGRTVLKLTMTNGGETFDKVLEPTYCPGCGKSLQPDRFDRYQYHPVPFA